MPAEQTHYQNEHWDIWIGRSYGNLVMESFVKTGDALKHLVWQVDDRDLTNAVGLTLRYGRVVRRPYVLGQACDGSISAPVMALYLDFCTRHGLDAQALYAEAYPEAELLEEDAITAFAQWQGVRLPHTWTAACSLGLLESLTEINCSTPQRASPGVTSSRQSANKSGSTIPGRARTVWCPRITGCRFWRSRHGGTATHRSPSA
jgi:hypothetical protein